MKLIDIITTRLECWHGIVFSHIDELATEGCADQRGDGVRQRTKCSRVVSVQRSNSPTTRPSLRRRMAVPSASNRCTKSNYPSASAASAVSRSLGSATTTRHVRVELVGVGALLALCAFVRLHQRIVPLNAPVAVVNVNTPAGCRTWLIFFSRSIVVSGRWGLPALLGRGVSHRARGCVLVARARPNSG